ncbi:hypothetical protein Tco_1512578, partial [Tanacetum coccineum]
PKMKETKAYKTYLCFATGATPPKKARKFKKPASPQLSIVPVSPAEPTGKSKRVKRPTKKSNKAPARGVVIRETPKMPLSKKKEKMTVEKRKGINLLSKVALIEEAQYEEVRRKSLRDFHKTHPSGSGTVTETDLSAAKIKPYVTNEGNGGNDEDASNDDHDSSGKDSDQENDNDDDKTQSDNENERIPCMKLMRMNQIKDKDEGDVDEEMDYATSQLSDDVDIRLNKPFQADDETVQKEGTDAELTNIQQRNENLEITHDQVIEDAHVTISTIAKKTEVPVTSSSYSSDLAAKFLNFADIPTIEAEIVSPIDVSVYIMKVSALEKDVSELKKCDPLKTQVIPLVDEHLDARLGATRDEFMNYLSTMVTESLEHAVLAKESSYLKSTYEAASSLTEFELKKILIDKIDESQSYLTAPEH